MVPLNAAVVLLKERSIYIYTFVYGIKCACIVIHLSRAQECISRMYFDAFTFFLSHHLYAFTLTRTHTLERVRI